MLLTVCVACSVSVTFAAAAKSVAVPVRLPVIVPLAVIEANVAAPSTFNVLSRSTAPVTSNVPGISTLSVHSTPVPPEFV